MSGLFFIVHSLGNDEMLGKALAQQSSHGLVSYVDPADQFDVQQSLLIFMYIRG